MDKVGLVREAIVAHARSLCKQHFYMPHCPMDMVVPDDEATQVHANDHIQQH
jgi:hypothetical protein